MVEALEIFDRIVCGVDGTPESLEAARQAERLRSPDGTLRLVDELDAAGEPVPLLRDEIERTEATLIAVGPRGHRRAVGILMGNVSTELLHNAPCSVLVARAPRFGAFPSSIIAGVDGSKESLAAADVAKSIAERFRSELLIVAATGGKGVDLEAIEALAAPYVTDPGHPVAALTELSAEADLLVLGSRGLHGLRALGSVSERVAHRASCSVLAVR